MIFKALVAATLVSLISLVGVFSLILNKNLIHKIVYFLIALSAGTLLGGAFFHILPEAIREQHDPLPIFGIFLIGFASFFVLERILRWRHCHKEDECKVHPVGIMNLVGDGLHNFIDGILIAVAFNTDFNLGITTTIAIILHEIPQEIGDFGVLIHAGYKPTKALFFNFLSALTAILGVLVGFWLGDNILGFSDFILPFAAGGFLHIAASDLVPELHNEKNGTRAVISFLIFVSGALIMWFLAIN